MSPESLAIKLRQARGAMSLAEAAELSEIPEERIRMYEEGVRRPYGKTLRRLADVYGVRVVELAGPGQVVRTRSRAPEIRRRRRRIAVPADEGGSISVPIEVAEGQTVRLVIELVVKRRQQEIVDEDYPSYAADAPRRSESPQPAPEEGGEVAEPLREPVAEGESAPGMVRRLRLAEESPRQPRDPILELKRAYSDFRHKKR